MSDPATIARGDLSAFIFVWFNERDPEEMSRCIAAYDEQRPPTQGPIHES